MINQNDKIGEKNFINTTFANTAVRYSSSARDVLAAHLTLQMHKVASSASSATIAGNERSLTDNYAQTEKIACLNKGTSMHSQPETS